jgi:hypothetical protein
MGGRDAIHFVANTSGTEPGAQETTEHCFINNLWIHNFSGSGIYCHNTSINYAQGLYATDIAISRCYAGINIDYKSEFCKFAHICTSWCYYGCINNGGNNVFTACTFHATHIGFYVDGTQVNAAHGTIDACTFCHIGSNAGSAITFDNITAGFIVSNSQFWYDSIDLTNCSGIVFSGCLFGRGTTGQGAVINVDGGGLALFSGCVFNNDVARPPQITVINDAKAVFSGCYGGVSGNEITA